MKLAAKEFLRRYWGAAIVLAVVIWVASYNSRFDRVSSYSGKVEDIQAERGTLLITDVNGRRIKVDDKRTIDWKDGLWDNLHSGDSLWVGGDSVVVKHDGECMTFR